MKIEMRGHGMELSRELREHVEQRFRYALDRFGERLRRVRVLLEDVNGPRGGEDVHCTIRVTVQGQPELVLREVQDDPFAAIARAADRVSHAIARRLERLHRRRRGRDRRVAVDPYLYQG